MKNKTYLMFLACFLASITYGAAEVSELLSLKNLAIPPSLGKMESRFAGQSERWVVHIQDVHAHFAAQENIAALVEHLHTYYGVNIVAIEGGWSASSFPKSWALPPARGKQMLARALLEEAYITGPIHSALFSTTPITVVGIEDKKLYEENRQVYIQHIQQREAVLEKVKALDSKIQLAKTLTFNRDLLTFDHALMEFSDGKNAEKFIPSLLSQAEAKGVDLSDLNQTAIFKKALEIEKSIDKEKLQSEAGRLMNEFKRKGLHFEELLKNDVVPEEKLEFYPNAQKYLELMHTQDEISHRQFFSEINTAVLRMKKKLLVSDDEKALDQRSSAIVLAKKIILFQATPDDLKSFETVKTDSEEDVQVAELSEALALGLQFYDLAKKRDQIFFDRIAKHPKLQGNIAVVTGGFHTEGLSAKLEEAGISYTVITPDLAKESADEKLYFKRLAEDSFSTQTIAQPQEKNLTKRFDYGFSYFVGMHQNFSDRQEAIRAVYSFQVGAGVPANEVEIEKSPVAGQNFSDLTPETQKNTVQEKFLELTTDKKPLVYVFIRATVLKQILDSNPSARSLFLATISNNANKFFVLTSDISEITNMPELEGRSNVKPLFEADFERAIASQRHAKKDSIAILDEDYKGQAAKVLLPPRTISLLLFRTLVESGWPYSWEDPKTQSLVEDILDKMQIDGLLVTQA